MTVVIETGRVRLRDLSYGDLPFVAEMLSHPEVMQHFEASLDLDGARAAPPVGRASSPHLWG